MRDLIIMPGNYLPINETRPKIQPTLILFPLIFFSAAAFLPSPIFLPPNFLFYPKNPSNLPAAPRTHQPLTRFPLPQLWLFPFQFKPPLSLLWQAITSSAVHPSAAWLLPSAAWPPCSFAARPIRLPSSRKRGPPLLISKRNANN